MPSAPRLGCGMRHNLLEAVWFVASIAARRNLPALIKLFFSPASCLRYGADFERLICGAAEVTAAASLIKIQTTKPHG